MPTNTAELFDPTINAFTPLANPMATARGTHTATLLRSGQVLIASGYDGNDYTTKAELFDIYRGRPLADADKSLAWRLTFVSDDRTLTEAEIDEAITTVADGLARDVSGRLRT